MRGDVAAAAAARIGAQRMTDSDYMRSSAASSWSAASEPFRCACPDRAARRGPASSSRHRRNRSEPVFAFEQHAPYRRHRRIAIVASGPSRSPRRSTICPLGSTRCSSPTASPAASGREAAEPHHCVAALLRSLCGTNKRRLESARQLPFSAHDGHQRRRRLRTRPQPQSPLSNIRAACQWMAPMTLSVSSG